MKRRSWGIGSVALASLGAGMWWQRGREGSKASDLALPGTGSGTGAGPQELWSQTVERVDGSTWSLSSLQGQAVIVNFWATWCPPCVREMPLLDRFAQAQRQQASRPGWRLVGLATDRREAVTRFLAERPVSYDIAVANLEAIAWSRSLGNDSGSLPFTVAFSPAGQLVYRKLGEITETELRSWALPGA